MNQELRIKGNKNHNSLFIIHNSGKSFGFTLIELLVAISIIGILSALLLPNLQGIRERARDAQRKNDLKEVKLALRMYYNDYQVYPTADDGQIHGCSGVEEKTFGWGDEFKCGSVVYMKKLSQAPLSTKGESYYYERTSDESFTLYACLENKSDESGSLSCGLLDCSWCFKVSAD